MVLVAPQLIVVAPLGRLRRPVQVQPGEQLRARLGAYDRVEGYSPLLQRAVRLAKVVVLELQLELRVDGRHEQRHPKLNVPHGHRVGLDDLGAQLLSPEAHLHVRVDRGALVVQLVEGR